MTAPSTTPTLDWAVHCALSETTDWFRRMGGGNCYPGFDDDHIPTFVGLLLAVAVDESSRGCGDFEAFRDHLEEQGRRDETLQRVCQAMRLDRDPVFPRELFDKVTPQLFEAVDAAPHGVGDQLDYLEHTVTRLLYRHPRQTWIHFMQTQLWSNATAPDAAGGAA